MAYPLPSSSIPSTTNILPQSVRDEHQDQLRNNSVQEKAKPRARKMPIRPDPGGINMLYVVHWCPRVERSAKTPCKPIWNRQDLEQKEKKTPRKCFYGVVDKCFWKNRCPYHIHGSTMFHVSAQTEHPAVNIAVLVLGHCSRRLGRNRMSHIGEIIAKT